MGIKSQIVNNSQRILAYNKYVLMDPFNLAAEQRTLLKNIYKTHKTYFC